MSRDRWRIALAVLVALASIPLLLLEGGSSADGETAAATAPAVVPTTIAPEVPIAPAGDPSPDLVRRADAWRAGRAAAVARNTEVAIGLAADAGGTTTIPADSTTTTEAPVEAASPSPTEAPAPTQAPPPPPTEPPPPTTTEPPPPPPTEPPPTTTAAPANPGEPTAAQWAALRNCESGGNYAAISPSGAYRGAYQFSQETWDWVAGGAASHLVGVDPAAAAPGDQDAMAVALWRLRGSSPWPSCGYHLH
ncbi:MAG: transglycosylase family protein [Acidimicrobiales bacterium]